MTRVNVNEWSLDNVEWVNVTDQIYQGGIVNSAVGVGSVCIKDNWLYYIFGGGRLSKPMEHRGITTENILMFTMVTRLICIVSG